MKIFRFITNYLVILALVIYGLFLSRSLAANYLFDWDESIYAELGAELRLDHDYLTPHWNQAIWLEKPPLVAYLSALGQGIFADPELGSRVFMPVVAVITLYLVYLIGSTLISPAGGVIAMGILSTMPLFLDRAHVLNTDGLLLLGMTLLAYLTLKGSSPWKLAAAAALAVFAKGPAGLLAIIIILPILIHKNKKYLWQALAYFLIFTLPWHLYQLIVHGSAFYTPYLLEQVIIRSTVPIEFHLESRWFYFIELYKNVGLGILLSALLGLVARRNLFVSWWIIAPLAIFTLAKTRLAWYILPIYPAIALSSAELFVSLAKPKLRLLLNIFALCIELQMLLVGWRAGQVKPSPWPDQLVVAKSLAAYPGEKLAALVSSSERAAEAILPKEQRISSSFRYGGAPAIVFYSRKNIVYYYNYDQFNSDLTQGKYNLVMVTTADLDKVPPGYHVIVTTPNYLGLIKDQIYAQR